MGDSQSSFAVTEGRSERVQINGLQQRPDPDVGVEQELHSSTSHSESGTDGETRSPTMVAEPRMDPIQAEGLRSMFGENPT